ncbi:MAG: NapC/NirT family cytochrome c [Pseudomonadota bacterium]
MSEQLKSSCGLLCWLAFAAAVAVGVFLTVGSSKALDATNTTEFCTSCHSMQWVEEEWMESMHYKNAAGVQAGCPDCHVPHPLGPKLYAKVMAAKDVWGEIMGTIDTEEKFEQHRWEMANRVWARMEATDSRECRSCHEFSSMDFSEQEKLSRKKHKAAEEEGRTCIECHKGVAHEIPDEPDNA